ncbi:AAA domain-containing protein [Paenibacillus radicis (ex Gao et al. 2016)]|uniref:Helicase n=1 Tax=Paenibacillus radicis (ex Gao et al. 2016) TaxID=1737354 RepID=A0A917LSK9_9BACL|nr:AAA domain-containing protein [Paenibacillus radicis (ex Gao et al. 2016)]GGG53239.1 helicase [Paenibacillus radicis (ex Gao et al. 2016)]
MDEQKVLILVDQIDKTNEIEYYNILEQIVEIKYKNSEIEYKFPSSRVNIIRNPVQVNIENQKFIYQGFPIRNVKFVMKFEGWLKFFFEEQHTRIYSPSLIQIIPEEDSSRLTIDPMDYWKDISQYTTIEDDLESFLKKQFSKLNVIHHKSVLASYLNKTPVEKTSKLVTPIIYPFKFNLSQKAALEQALSSNISIIEGPPGTGKTQTILNILANLTVIHKKSVAVVSGNNAAVQNVRDKLDDKGYGFMVAALGKWDNRKAFFNNLPEPDVIGWDCEAEEKQIGETINELTHKLERLLLLANRKAEIERMISAYRLEQKHYQFHNDERNLDDMKRLFFRNQTADTIISFLVDEYFLGERSFRFLQKAKLLFKYGFFDFKKLREDRLELITRLQTKYYESKLSELEREKDQIDRELKKESFKPLLQEHEMYSTQLFKKKLFEKYHGKSKYKGNVNNYRNRIEDFLKHYPIVLSTTHALRSCIPDDYLFDYVIVDEASQVDLLTGVLAMSCAKRIIIVGDTKQLPQIVDEKIENKLKTSDVEEPYNYFKHSLLSSMFAIYGQNIPRAMLKEHYRCKPKIIGFCNDQYYNNDLIPMTTEEESDVSIRLHYTAIGNHMRRVTVGKDRGNFNHREIDVVKEEIIKELQLNDVPLKDIGFTTPYRLQVTEANSQLEQIEIDTVHRYQGREKPVMILSTVLDQTKSGKFGKQFVENPNLVNVAVSRAQNQFILVTDHSLFRNSRKDIGDLIRYIEYNTLHEHITQSQLISVFDLLYSEYSDRLNGLQARLINKSKFKSENIIWRVLSDLMEEDTYKCFTFSMQVYLKDIFKVTDQLNETEKKYVKNRASFDFVVYDAINKQPLLAIEVNGFNYHRNNLVQTERDKLKHNICVKYDLSFLPLLTTGSNEIIKIRNKLNEFL